MALPTRLMLGSRNDIRRIMREQRRALPAYTRHRLSERVCRNIARSTLFHRSKRIALYLSNDGEIDLTPLVLRAWAMGKKCYLPVLGTRRRLWFAPFHRGSVLVRNRFGILEPTPGKAHMQATWGLDLLLAPLVAFDSAGNRLGMGGGYYDRTLFYLKLRQHWRKPHLLGVAYSFQEVEKLIPATWDIPLQGIATEQEVIWLQHG